MKSVTANPNFNERVVLEKGDVAGALYGGRLANNTKYTKNLITNYEYIKYVYWSEDEQQSPSASIETVRYIKYFYDININPYLNYYFEYYNFVVSSVPTSAGAVRIRWRETTDLLTGGIDSDDTTTYYWQGSAYIPDLDAYSTAGINTVEFRIAAGDYGFNQRTRIKRMYLSSSASSLLTTVNKGTV